MWNRPDVDFIQSQDVAHQRVEPDSFGFRGGGLKRVLSRDDADGAETALYRIADRQEGVVSSDVDFYVVDGGALLNDEPLRSGDYVHAPAGARIDLRPDVTGLKLYAGFWGPTTWAQAVDDGGGELLRVRPETQRWVPAEWSGETALEPGAMVKELRVDAKAFIYLAAMMPGWHCDMAEAHPVYEESFKIYGDTLMGSRGVMRQGAYFYRGPGVFHGPLYSRGGTMSFIRSDARTSTEYRSPEPGGTWQQLSAAAYPGGSGQLRQLDQDPT